MKELEHDANCIISLLATTGSQFSEVVKELEHCDDTKLFQWIVEALNLIYTAEGPPENNVTDDSKYINEDYEPIKTLGASDGACMVTALIAQWVLRFMCKKLMQLMTPEAAILKRKYSCVMCNYF